MNFDEVDYLLKIIENKMFNTTYTSTIFEWEYHYATIPITNIHVPEKGEITLGKKDYEIEDEKPIKGLLEEKKNG